ncbi:MAG: carbon monoxide dehydrogenase subunit G [Ardenticatenaceae bacterium]|nr:carbon monoxide dehydrogenase subunit G [Ardenticatenaceae bacterium]
MEVSGEYTFDAPQNIVWQALQDPDVLASIMPGGEGFSEVGENEYEGSLNIKVGPVQGKFKGNIKLSDIVAPESYTIEVDGKGAPGFVKATGGLKLTNQGEQTHMVYEGKAQVGGRIASVGQRLMDTSAKSIIRQSLEGLNAYLQAQVAANSAANGAATAVPDPTLQSPPEPPKPAYTPPSQTQVAVEVAKDVANDLIPAQYRPALIAGGVIVLLIILYFIFT